MSENVQPTNNKLRRLGIYLGVLLIAFLLGFLPMWIKGRQCSASLADSERHLSLSRIENALQSAVIYSRHGEYEVARQATSQFFTSLRTESEKGEASGFTAAQRQGMNTVLASRDDMVTLLARGDPASADRLFDLFVSYKKLMTG